MVSLSRRQSKIIAFSLLGAFFALSLILAQRPTPPKRPTVAARIAEQTPPIEGSITAEPTPSQSSAQITMNNFHRAETKDGKTVWEITATTGAFAPKTGVAELDDSEMKLYADDGAMTRMLAARAELSFSGNVISYANAFGGVTVTTADGAVITTQRAEYNQAKDTLITPGEVTIVNPSMEIRGQRMVVTVSKEEAVLSGGVTTLIKGAAADATSKESTSSISAE